MGKLTNAFLTCSGHFNICSRADFPRAIRTTSALDVTQRSALRLAGFLCDLK